MSNPENPMEQVRELLFGEQMHVIEAHIKELSEQFNREILKLKEELKADYEKKISDLKNSLIEAEKSINSNMANRYKLSDFFSEIAAKLGGDK